MKLEHPSFWEVFFCDIPAVVFEPVVVAGWLGLITALVVFRKEKSVLYWTLALALPFMILWRCGIRIVSSRYAEIMIFPMIVAAAFFVFRLEHLRDFFPRVPEKFVKFLPAALLIVLTLSCLIKDFRFSPYNPFMEAGFIVKADKSSEKSVVYAPSSDRCNQIRYYTGKEVKILTDAPPLQQEQCRRIIADASAHSYKTVYIFAVSSANEKPLAAVDAGVKNSDWHLMTERFFNAKKKKILRVYKFHDSRD